VQSRSGVANGGLLVGHGRQRLIGNLNALQRVIGSLTRLGDNQRDAFADEANPVDRHYRPVRHHSARYDPVRFDVGDLAGDTGAGEGEAHTGGDAGCRKVYASNAGMRMRRPEDRQAKHAG
jgi:hypothetical protein